MRRGGLIDRLVHRRRYDLIPADEVNDETGTMDFYCGCKLCRWIDR